uniref:Superkiller viralicidic activity 2-like 2 n=1 Tax=Globodera rostochiensis TaxID=31243 RepID=A0A914HBQ6_GLORO
MDALLDDIDGGEQENSENESASSQQQSSNTMERLEHEKQTQARAFSENLLAKLGGGGSADQLARSRKRSATDANGVQQQDEASPPAKVAVRDSESNIKDEVDGELGDDVENRFIVNCKRIRSIQYAAETNCNHEVVYPFDVEHMPLKKSSNPAKFYEFKLDMFQKQAIKCLDNSQSVLVSAHTSAGKTVAALYAIAMALRDKQRVIYTSPIKALSNQKYRELVEEFEDVGLVTGDVTLNPNASCVVMTTEILRSMLYRGSEIMREVGWVIFDEIHYMRDKERGVVWEETLILLPQTTHLVFLSATIPNAKQFAEWICYLRHKPCNVVYTDYRPVPLQHLIYSAGSDGLWEVVNIKGEFKQDNFAKAMSCLNERQPTGNEVRPLARRSAANDTAQKSNVVKIIRTIRERDMLPCIIFSFSRKECEAYASEIKDIDFNTEEEKRAIKLIFNNATDLLSDEDKKLSQIRHVLPYLMRGIGIHHSGQLPIMKEVVEILFGEGLIKTLFATETFAMGINMPAKTVLFTSARKFDGTSNRWITSGEYIQMSGRAGRRGKDDKGLVILMVDQQMSSETVVQIIKGTSDALNSQFRLTYNMVLNLLRVPDINPEFLLEKSFYQWQNYSRLPDLLQALNVKRQLYQGAQVDHLQELEGLFRLEKQIEQQKSTVKGLVLRPAKVVRFFQPGRMLKLKCFDKDFGWGVLIKYNKKPNPLNPLSPELLYFIDAAVFVSRECENFVQNLCAMKPPAAGETGVVVVLPFAFDCIQAVSTIRLKVPQELKSKEACQAVGKTILETKRRFDQFIPELDPIEHMNISDPQLKKSLEELRKCEERFKEHPLRSRPDFDELWTAFMKRQKLEEEYKQAKKDFENGRKLSRLDELGCRKRVLRRLGYATDEDTITEKGRVACELSSADELLLTEMIFTSAFTNLSAPEAAALLSCFVFQERAPIGKLSDSLSEHLRTMQGMAKKIAKISNECKLELDEEKYVESFCPAMMAVVFKWCSGATFAELLESTDIFEGSIIRCMRRLEELLQEMVNAARSMGDRPLEQTFEQARSLLKRDIVFSASLYL